MLRYPIYGLDLYSEQSIPALIPASDTNLSNKKVYLTLGCFSPKVTQFIAQSGGQPPWHISEHLDENGQPGLQVWQLHQGEYFWLRYSDGIEFVIDRLGETIEAIWPESMTLDDVCTYLLGSVLGWLLRLRGVVCLHASAVKIGEEAVVFVGEAGAGKSTTAAAFAKLGYPVLSDDVVPLVKEGNEFWVQTAYPRIRLWSDSVAALYDSPNALPRILPTHPLWDKRYLDLTQEGYRFQESPLRLGAIYLLGTRINSDRAPSVERLSDKDALLYAIANTYTNLLLDKQNRAAEFEMLSRLVKLVSVRQVTPHLNPSYIPKLCQTILEDLKT